MASPGSAEPVPPYRTSDVVLIACIALFVVGASRVVFTELVRFRAGAKMLLLSSLVAGVAFGIGTLEAYLTGRLSLTH